MTPNFPKPVASTGRNGFTLLEIIVSLAIVAVLATLFAVRFAEESVGEELREPSAELRKLARAANRQAAAFRNEYRITFFKDAFFLSRAPLIERHNAEEIAEAGFVMREQAPFDMQIRRFGNPKWIEPNGAAWVFQPAGLSEPISIRFSNEDGFIELDFNPLTAMVDEERFLFE